MKLHANAKTCPNSRALIASRVLDEGWTLRAAAEAAGCSVRTAAKWVARLTHHPNVTESLRTTSAVSPAQRGLSEPSRICPNQPNHNS